MAGNYSPCPDIQEELRLSAHGKRIVTAAGDNIKIWDIAYGKELLTLSQNDTIASLMIIFLVILAVILILLAWHLAQMVNVSLRIRFNYVYIWYADNSRIHQTHTDENGENKSKTCNLLNRRMTSWTKSTMGKSCTEFGQIELVA